MFERFTDRARRVVVLSQEEARRLNHNYIGTEHVLLGLLEEGQGVAARVLTSLGVSLDEARNSVEEIIGHGTQAPSDHVPFTPRAKKVLELSLREALQLGHNYIGTEHLLLGLLREGEGVAAQVMVRLGAELGQARNAVMRALEEMPERFQEPAAEFVIRSLQAENRRLRAEVDRLRAALLRHGADVGDPSPTEPGEPDEPDELHHEE
jgi:ATP-dependent Clp protease ATP-binding subunit ClpC